MAYKKTRINISASGIVTREELGNVERMDLDDDMEQTHKRFTELSAHIQSVEETDCTVVAVYRDGRTKVVTYTL